MRRSLCVLLVGLTALAASGCGAQKTAERAVGNALDPVAQAATKAASAGSVAIAIDGKLTAAGRQIPISGTGAFDLQAARGRLDLTTTVPGHGDVTLQEILAGQTVFVHSDAFGALLPGGKQWVKVDLQELAAKAGIDLQQLGAGTDPTQFLQALKRSTDVQKVGDETIDGTATTHYRATIDVAKALDATGDPRAHDAARQLQQRLGLTRIPVDVWVGEDGLVRRVALDLTSTGSAHGALSLVMDFKDYGAPVDVQPPAAGDTIDLGQLLPVLHGG
jgi:hypothetical protein